MLINALDFNEDLFQAVGTARLHHQLMPNDLGAENGFDPLILADLAKRGHKVNFIRENNKKEYINSRIYLVV